MSKTLIFILAISIALTLMGCAKLASGSSASKKMTAERMGELVGKIDEKVKASDNSFVFTIREREHMIVFDKSADRMRIMTPVAPAGSAGSDIERRMLQANFDAVLDSRYAIANDMVWSVFIHPLSTLDEDDFLSAIAQTFTAAETYGSSYTSGALVFGGGDSNAIHEDLLKELEKAAGSDGRDI